MTNFLAGLPHLLIVLAVIGVAAALAALHDIDGAAALGIIGAAGGFSIGAQVTAAAASSTATTTTSARQNVPA